MRVIKRPTTSRRRRTHAGDDRGSIIVAMTVVLILFLIATATLARVMDGLTVAVKNRAYSSALGLADAGLSDALFRIDQQTAATSSFCVGQGCALQSVLALPGIQYRAIVPLYPNSNTPNPDEFIVQSEGSVNGELHALQAVVQRNEAAPFAAFAVNGITLNGHGSDTTITSSPPGNPAPIGSDGSIICHGGGHDGTSQQVYGGGSDNCPVPVRPPGSYDPAPPTLQCNSPFTYMDPCAWGNSSSSTSTGTWTPTETYVSDGTSNPEVVAQSCPSGNTFGNSSSTTPTQYAAGVYVCFGNVTFAGTVEVTNVTSGSGSGVTSTDDGDTDDGMQVFVFNTPKDPSPTVDMSGSTINPTQSARDFRLYVAGTSPTIKPGSGSAAATVTGLIWAPTASLTVNGGQMTIDGSLVVGSLTINGNPNLNLIYDYALADLVQQNWQVGDYTEIPVRCFSDNPTDSIPLTSSCPSV
jgi:hypothetical protein